MNLRILKQPRLTEKTWSQKELSNQVTFLVDINANKIEIRKAVEKAFGVTVENVNTIITHGKYKRMGRHIGQRADRKKAIITLKKGDVIEYFEGA